MMGTKRPGRADRPTRQRVRSVAHVRRARPARAHGGRRSRSRERPRSARVRRPTGRGRGARAVGRRRHRRPRSRRKETDADMTRKLFCRDDPDRRGHRGLRARRASVLSEPATSTASTTTDARRCAPARPVTATNAVQHFRFDGHERSYLLAVPAGDDGTRPRPLILDFHGWGGDMQDLRRGNRARCRGPGTRRRRRHTAGARQPDPLELGRPRRADLTTSASCTRSSPISSGACASTPTVSTRPGTRTAPPSRACSPAVRRTSSPRRRERVGHGAIVVSGRCRAEHAHDSRHGGSDSALRPGRHRPRRRDLGEERRLRRHNLVGTNRSAACTGCATTLVRRAQAWWSTRSSAACTCGPEVRTRRRSPANSKAGQTFPATREVLDFFARHRRSWGSTRQPAVHDLDRESHGTDDPDAGADTRQRVVARQQAHRVRRPVRRQSRS